VRSAIDIGRRRLLVGSTLGIVAVSFGAPGCSGAVGGPASGGRAVNAFVVFEPDGTITLINPAIEMGQGSGTALAQVLADALDADWSLIRVRGAPYSDAYGHPRFGGRLVTADSAATAEFWPILRRAGEQARVVLIWNAMAHWRCPAHQVRTEAGWLVHEDGRRMAYADLAPRVELPRYWSSLPQPAPSPSRLVGQPLLRLDLAAKLRGTWDYGVDSRSTQALVAVLLPADRVGAVLADAGDASARATPGVVDVRALPDRHAVAVVARDTWSALQGRRALRPIWVAPAETYDSEAALKRFAEIAAVGAPDAHVVRSVGAPVAEVPDRDAGAAPQRIVASVVSRHVTHAALEPLNAQATPTWMNQGADIIASTQAPSLDMRRAAQTAKRPPPVFNVQSTGVGGAFGRRVDNEVAGTAAWLALQLGSPVQVLQFVSDDIAHGQVRTLAAQHLEATLDARGRIVSWLHRTVGCATTARLFPERFAKEGFDQTLVDGSEHLYRIAEQRIESIHRPLPVACSFLRGVGAGFNLLGVESVIDEAADRAGQDALAYRLGLLEDARARRVVQALGEWLAAADEPGADGHAFMALRGSCMAMRARVRRGAEGQPQLVRLQCVVEPDDDPPLDTRLPGQGRRPGAGEPGAGRGPAGVVVQRQPEHGVGHQDRRRRTQAAPVRTALRPADGAAGAAGADLLRRQPPHPAVAGAAQARLGFGDFISWHVAGFDAIILAQTTALALESHGLGICYMGTTLHRWAIADFLDCPDHCLPVTSMVVGWPAEAPPQRDRLPGTAWIHDERYQRPTPADIDAHFAERERRGRERYLALGPEMAARWAEHGITSLAQFYTSKIKYDPDQFAAARARVPGLSGRSVTSEKPEGRSMPGHLMEPGSGPTIGASLSPWGPLAHRR
jgi:isoquinoline 1-oxidoreductase beta subunit